MQKGKFNLSRQVDKEEKKTCEDNYNAREISYPKSNQPTEIN